MSYPTVTSHPKLYPFTDVQTAPYNCDPTGVADIAAAIEDIKSYQANTGTIYFPHGTYKLATNLTLPLGMTMNFERGASLTIATGITLTLNYEPTESWQIFNCVGTGKVVFAGGTVTQSNPVWWGDKPDDTTNCTAAIQAAITAAPAGIGPTVVPISPGIHQFTNLVLSADVSLVGVGRASVLKCIGTGSAITTSEDLWTTGEVGYKLILDALTIDSSANANDFTQVDFTGYSVNMCSFLRVSFRGNTSQAQQGLCIPSGTGKDSHNNLFNRCQFVGLKSANGALQLGDDTTGKNSNNNVISQCKFNTNATHIRILGDQNNIESCTIPAVTSPVKKNNSGGTNFRIYLTKTATGFSPAAGSQDNHIGNNYFDGGNADVIVYATAGKGTQLRPYDIGFNYGLNDTNQVWDVASDQVYTVATDTLAYSSATECTIVTNITAVFLTGHVIYLDCGADGLRRSTITTVTGGGPYTITIADAVLTNNLASIAAEGYAVGSTRRELGPIFAREGQYLPEFTVSTMKTGRTGTAFSRVKAGTLTLTANAASTAITDDHILSTSKLLLLPTSANAAADVGSATGVYQSTTVAGSITVVHPNTAAVDKTFNYFIYN